jgi:hypothetical protein
VRGRSQAQTGGVGASYVAGDFEAIGWGKVEVPERHDLGTDLILFARDDRLVDLGMVMGAQVKAGPSFFKEEVKDQSGNVAGWWFRESTREHFDYWLDHQLPHIVVLHDDNTHLSYWVHITKEVVKYTRKGAKIFVPGTNVVNADNASHLRAVAASKAPRANWEGSVWNGAVVSPTHRLRHALLVPRLAAPHPNRGGEPAIEAVQVLAMLVQARLRDIANHRHRHGSIPDLDAVGPEAGWEWQFAGAMRRFLTEGDAEVFLPLTRSPGIQPHENAAATVAFAAGLIENGRADEAVRALDDLLALDNLDLVDHSWVTLQRSRALTEIGHWEEARSKAIDLLATGQLAPDDVTAAAVGGAAARLVLTLADWREVDLATTISASDTTASWWRQQVSSWGLSALADKSFKTWAGDNTVTLIGGDQAWLYLRSASLMAGLLGDHAAWRHTFGELARYMLADPDHGTESDVVTEALTMLRRCGDAKGLRLAARRVVDNGPAVAARDAAAAVDLDASTHTSAQADLKLLVEAADMLPPDRAYGLAKWAMHTYADPDGYRNRVKRNFSVRDEIAALMLVLVEALEPEVQEEIADFVLDLPAQTHQGRAASLGQIVDLLPASVWTPDRARRAADRADADNCKLTFPLLGAAAPYVPRVRERLMSEARDGSLDAYAALDDRDSLTSEDIRSLLAILGRTSDGKLAAAAKNHFYLGSRDIGRAAIYINLSRPECADWEIVYRQLSAKAWRYEVAETLQVLADRLEDLPDEVAARLAPLVEAVASAPDPPHVLVMRSDPRPLARRLVGALRARAGDLPIDQLSVLARGSVQERREAAWLARSMQDATSLGVLVALAGDPEPGVRAVASRMIAERAATGDDGARTQLPTVVDDNGTLVARAVSAAVQGYPQLAQEVALRPFRTHLSRLVRARMSAAVVA